MTVVIWVNVLIFVTAPTRYQTGKSGIGGVAAFQHECIGCDRLDAMHVCSDDPIRCT